MIFWAYNGCLISYLAIDIDQHPFTSFKGLAGMPSDFKLVIMKNGYAESLINQEIRLGNQDVIAIKDRVYRSTSYTESIELVKQGFGAGLHSNIREG